MVSSYWKEFYSDAKNTISILKPSGFAHEVFRHLPSTKICLDIGAGTGRDSFFFASNGIRVLAIDGSSEAITSIKRNNSEVDAFCFEFSIECKTTELIKYVKEIRDKVHGPLLVYLRFVAHAVPRDTLKSIIEFAREIMLAGDVFASEHRVSEEEKYVFGQHFRLPIKNAEIREMLGNDIFKVTLDVEKTGFSTLSFEDPVLGRLIVERI
jgi:tellurite methyltransferase